MNIFVTDFVLNVIIGVCLDYISYQFIHDFFFVIAVLQDRLVLGIRQSTASSTSIQIRISVWEDLE